MVRRSNTGSLNRRTLAAAVASCFAAAANANPTNPTVMSGSAAFSSLGNTYTITNSPNAIIHWQGFSIQANEITRFLQQNASSAVLNRVTGGNMSQLLGQLLSNGRVFLINPSGIVVGQGAVIDVAALVASSLNLSDADFLAGRYRFTQQIGAGSIINQGTITTPAGGQVYLVAPNVENHGVITAPNGEVILAAGRSVEIVNAGTPNIRVELTAPDGEALNLGEVVAQAGRVGIYGASVRNAGRVSANTAVVGENGKIVFKATGSVSLDAGSRAETIGPGTGEIEISAGENLTVRGVAQSGGTMAVDVGGDLSVISDTAAVPPQPMGLRAQTGQTIQARSIAVTSTGGIGSIASIMTVGGDQTINVAGGDIDVRSLGSGTAQISNFGPGSQVISVSGGNHVAVDGTGGRAAVESFGSQSLSLSGGGANALVVGSAGGQGASAITGVGQTITAGASGEAGSITVTGPAAPGAATTLSSLIENRGGAASTQNISTSGAISIIGGTAPSHGANTSSGISNLASAQQTITADSLSIQGGPSGTNNTAAITSIAIQGSGQPSGNQQINVSGDISLIGGAGGSALLSSSGAQQTVTARDITLVGGLGGVASAAAILAPRQTIIARDVTLTARSSAVAANGALPGARIGGNGGATDLELHAANVTLNGGTGVNNGVGLGSSSAGTAFANSIRVDATGNVTLNGGTAAGTTARIGTGNAQAPAAGDIRITAGGDILLNGGTGPAAIRTTGDVSLSAANLAETPSGFIQANKLTLKASGNADLGGPNQVSILSAPSATLLPVPPLPPVIQPGVGGSLAFNNNGNLAVADTVSSGGPMNITVAGVLNVNGNGVQDAVLLSNGGQNITAQSINLTASNNRRANIENQGAGNQSITATAGDMNLIAVGGSGVAQIVNRAPGASQTLSMSGLLNVLGGATTVGARNSGVFQNSGGVQRITSSGITLQASPTGTAPASASGAQITAQSGDQVIDAGSGNIQLIGATGGSGNTAAITSLGNQEITAQDVSLVGGSGTAAASGAFLTGGRQTISAQRIEVRGGSGAGSNLALISTTTAGGADGDQTINVGAGGLQITGGEISINNRAGLSVLGNQALAVAGDIVLTGGASGGAAGNTNTAFITAGVGKTQTINAGSLTMTSGTGGIDNSAVISGSIQTITTTGSVFVNGSSGGGSAPGPRIGGQGGAAPVGPTNLTMNIGGDLILTGGSVTNNAATIGTASNTSPSPANNITITAGGSVILNQGSGSVARIGTSLLAPTPGAGDISITATTGSIQLNGSTQATVIRTTGSVTLNAGTTITEGAQGFIHAGSLTTTSSGDTSLIGPNQVASFRGTTTAGGNLTLNNAGPLVVQAINAANVALTNAGSVAVRGPLAAGGTLNMNATGALSVEAGGTQDVIVSSFGGQTISAQSLSVTAQDGRTASLINNASGDQMIAISGAGTSAGVDVRTLAGGGTASIINNVVGASQTVAVTDADHINVIAGSGVTIPGSGAFIRTLSGTQTVSIIGSGANAIRIGDAASGNLSDLRAQNQTVVAGLSGQSGSIAITGPTVTPGVGALAGIVSQGVPGGTQTVSTSGTLSVTGGGSANQLSNFQSGIFHNGTGLQSVSAGDIVLQGGATGANNGAFISTAGNAAVPHADQLINVVRDISISGGAGGSASISGGRNKLQTINARNITVTNPLAGGSNSGTGTILGTTQVINASGDVALTARSGSGSNTGVRIGGATYAGVNVPTDLTLNVGGNLTLTGGTAPNNGVGIGSASAGTVEANNIRITTGGNVVLNSGATSGTAARIGSSFLLPGVAGGDISVTAGGDIQLNGGASPVAIRTTGNVALTAANMSEAGDASIQANKLTLRATGNANLGGPNQVTSLSAPSVASLPGVGGSLTFNNNSSLNVADTVSSGGMMTLNVAGALNVNGNGVQDAQLLSFGGQSITAQEINLTASNNRRSTIQNTGGSGQSITATAGGVNLQALGGSGVAQIINTAPGASQTLSMTGLLNVLGGRTTTGSFNSGVFQNVNALQSVSSSGIVLQASSNGTPAAPSGAAISSAGNQVIDAGSGNINMASAAGGNASISAGSAANQAATQTISAHDISLANGTGGINGAATILAPHQTIHATGDVTLTAQEGVVTPGNLAGVRIGGNGTPGTDLNMTVGGSLTLDGGSAPDNVASIGSSGAGIAGANNITITANGNVILNGGGASGSAARIGTGPSQAPAAGNITVQAGSNIHLTGNTGAATIRTAGDVSLVARNISENANGSIHANKLTLKASENADLGGPNQVSSLSAPSTILPPVPPLPPITQPGVGGSLTFNNNGSLNVADTVSSGGMMTLNVAGALNVNGNGVQDAQLLSFGGQSITAQEINLTASNNRRSTIQNTGGAGQSITATAGGVNLQALGGSGVAQIVNSAPGASQTLSMSGLLNVLGGRTTTGSFNSGVFQNVNALQSVSSSGIVLQASSIGTTAAPSGAIISSAGNQVIDAGSGNINMASAAGGNASISAGSATNQSATQSISAHDISLVNGTGGINGAATILAPHQTIHATGDVTLTAQAGVVTPGNLAGIRIGGNGIPGTDLNMTVGGNLALIGGSAADNAASIGSSGAGIAGANNITISTGGNVTLTGGTAPGSVARIGTGTLQAPSVGDITITSGGSIQLDGSTQTAAIRTAGNVTLGAASMSETGDAYIAANKLTLRASGNANLGGSNQVTSLSAPFVPALPPAPPGATQPGIGGNLTFNNNGSLNVADTVSSGGMMTLNVAGALNVNGNGVQDAVLVSFGGQDITAHSINLTASNNRRANIENRGIGNQTLTATAGGMSLQALGGSGVAQIINNAPGASQTLNMSGLLNVLGGTTGNPAGSRNSGVFQNANGLQSISSTGIVLQASAAGTNPAAPSGAQIASLGGGDQVINAGSGDISLLAADGGASNSAIISSLGNQTIDARNISLVGGNGGVANVAAILAPRQTITATGDVTLTAQTSTVAPTGAIPGARIGGNGGATDIDLRAVNVTLNGGTAADNGAGIGSSGVGTAFDNRISIEASGNVTLNGGTAPGTNVRIGTGTLQPAAAGNISVIAGGDIQLNGAAGAAAIRTTGDVTLAAMNMSESGNAYVQASKLTLRATGSANLGGPNQVSTLSAPNVLVPPPAPPGAFVPGVGGSLTFSNNGSLNVADTVSSGGMMTLNVAGALNVNGNGLQDAQLLSFGGQNITAQSVNLTASNNRRSNIENRGAGNQSITATAGGMNLLALGGSGVAQIINSAPGASQTLAMTGLLNVLGGTTTTGSRNSGVFQNASGLQGITASGILLQASDTGNAAAPSGAVISSTAGLADQTIQINGGSIVLNGASGGSGNGAAIVAGRNQTISGNADIFVNGGAGGNASITAGVAGVQAGVQTISAHDISLTNAATGGSGSSGTLLAETQVINAAGNVTLTSQASGGTLPGTRIGGFSGTGSNVNLTVGGNLTISGGTAADNGAGIGSSASGTPGSNNITINTGGNVVLNGGSAALAGARIGSSTVNGVAGGNISVTAGGNIQLNGNTAAAAIRTTGNVNLTAGGVISENANGLIQASTLTSASGGDTALIGPNQVASFSGSSGGNLTFNNAGPLVIQAINAANAALITAASVHGNGAISTGTGFTVAVSADSELNGVISGAGGLNKNGVGFLTLGAVNTYTGDTNVNAGTLALGAADQTTTGNINIAGGATFRGSPGTYTNAGVIGGNGTLDVSATNFTSSGTLRPGGANAIGTLTVQGNAVINGLLDIEAQGSGAGNHDVLAVTGAATLGGALNVTPINGYAPQGGDTLVPLTFASRSGALNVSPDDWSSTYNPANLTLSFSALNRWIAASGHWDLASNWSLGHVPTNFERVLIDVPGSQFVTVSRGSQAAERLTSFENFILSGGSLNLGGPSTFNGSFSLLGGELKGNGNVAVNGAFVWAGGRMSGTGAFLTSAGSVSLLSPLLDDDLFLGKSWTNRGTAQWIGLQPGSIKGGGSIRNEGTFSFDGRNAVVETPFSNSGTLNVDTNVDLKLSSQNAGTINVGSGVKLKVHGTYTNLGRLAGKGMLDLDGGKLVNLGTLAPGANGGNGIGTFTVLGDFQQGATGVLEIDLGGTHLGQYDALNVDGKATLGGTLFLRTANGYVPHDGDDFRLVTYKSHIGAFDFILPPAGFTVDADYRRKVASFELD